MNKIAGIWLCVGLAIFLGVGNSVWALSALSVESTNGSSYVGAEKCKLCHVNEYETWSKTKHAEAYAVMDHAYQMLRDTGRGTRPWIEIGRTREWCDSCHTTGKYANGSYVLKNVQCERCHLAGKEHVESGGGKATESVNWSAELCRQCHGGSQHPQYDDWKQSAHSRSLSAAGGVVSQAPKCQVCHVAQAVVKSDFSKIEIDLADKDNQPINCQTCHNPHGSGNFRELRYPPDQLCAQCHNLKGPKIFGKIAHTQASMFNGSIMDEAGVTCYNCHMYVKVYESEISPRVTGHTFEQKREQCVANSCHPGKDEKWAEKAVNVRQTEVTTLLTAVEGEVKILNDVILAKYPTWDGSEESIGKNLSAHGANAVERYIQARYNIDFIKADKSKGFHNGAKARTMLDEARVLTSEGMDSMRTEIAAPLPGHKKGLSLPGAVLLIVVIGIGFAISFELYKYIKR